ncbi:hypothetical protein ACHAW5_010260 [Stephanodiscus triporus]|uniref:Uncharacterized protein n=1 Tax=Stephanodiscus triporus TaxID=2934178 RepID=A0ABD3N219_9STRA
MIKFHPIVFAVFGFASAAGETPTVVAAAGRYCPFLSLTLLARAGINKSCSAHALSTPSLHIEDEHIASAFQIKASCCQRHEPGRARIVISTTPLQLRGWEGWIAESIELHRDSLGGGRDAIQSTVEDNISKDETARLATILGFHTAEPSSEAILAEVCTRDVTEDVPDYPRELYVVLEDTIAIAPLDMVERTRTLLNALRVETGMMKAAVRALGEDVIVGEMDGKENGGEENDGEGGVAPAKKDDALAKGEKVAMTPSPTIMVCSALEACSTSHVDALGEEEEGASAFEEAMLCGLGGADANRMKSHTPKIPKTRTLAEIHVSGDNALDNEEECVLASAFAEAERQCGETSSRGTSCVGGIRGRRTRGRRVSFPGGTSSEESSGEGNNNEGTNSSSGTSRGENMWRMNNRVEMDLAGVGRIVERWAEHGAVLGKALASESFTVGILLMMMTSVILVVLPVGFTRIKCSRGPPASGVNDDTLALGLSLFMEKSHPYQLKKDASMLNPGNHPSEAFDAETKVSAKIVFKT